MGIIISDNWRYSCNIIHETDRAYFLQIFVPERQVINDWVAKSVAKLEKSSGRFLVPKGSKKQIRFDWFVNVPDWIAMYWDGYAAHSVAFRGMEESY